MQFRNNESKELGTDDEENIHQHHHDKMDSLWTKVLGTRMIKVKELKVTLQPIYEANKVSSPFFSRCLDGN